MRRRLSSTRIGAAALLALSAAIGLAGLGATAASAAPASTIAKSGLDDFSFDSFHADYVLGKDGEGRSTLHTTEHFVARFPDFDQNRGFIRAIPRVFDGHWVEPGDLTVTDEQGRARSFWTETSGDFLRVVMAVPEGSYVHGVQHYVIDFTQHDVTKFYEDTNDDEFYWDLNGTDTQQPFGEVSATLTLADGLETAFNGGASCYRGPLGSDTACPITADAGTFSVRESALGPGENVSIAIGFVPGTFAAAPESSKVPESGSGDWRANSFMQNPFGIRDALHAVFGDFPALLVGGLAGIGGAIALFVRGIGRGKESRTGRAIIAQYDPPQGVSVAVSAAIVRAQYKAMTASLLDFAVRRKIVMLHDVKADMYGAAAVDSTGLLPDELLLYNDVFEDWQPRETIWFDAQSTHLGDAAAAMNARAKTTAKRMGLIGKRRSGTIALSLLVLFVAFVLLCFQALASWGLPGGFIALVLGFIAFVASSILSGFISLGREPLTREGGLLHDHLMGLKEYIRLAEADRIRMLQSASGAEVDEHFIVQVYERLLPYAVLFGYEKEWQAELAQYYREAAPDWVSGDPHFSTAIQFAALHAAIASSPATPPISSGSSWGSGSGGSFSSFSGGSSGGGFSGGGGGGGGTSGI